MKKNNRLQLSLEWTTTINKIVEGILTNNNVDITTDEILALLKNHFGVIMAACYLVKGNKLSLYSFTQRKIIKRLLSVLPKNAFEIDYNINDKRILITRVIRENIQVQSKSLIDFFYPAVSPKWLLNKVQGILKAKLFIGIPIRIQDKAKGVYLIALEEESLSDTELHLLQFYVNLAGIAFDNNLKFQNLQSLYQAEKETTATLSHELKTPLAIAFNSVIELQLFIKNLQQRKDLDLSTKDIDELSDIAKRNSENVKHLTHLTDSILTLNQLQSPEGKMVLHTLNLQLRLEQLIIIFKQKAQQKGLLLEYTIDIPEGNWHGPGLQLEQIFTILIDNALKYTQKGSIRINVIQKTSEIFFTVTDTGPGIPRNKRKIIFEKFYRHRTAANKNLQNINGIGLGLYIGKKIVNLLNGTIEVSNNPKGQGTQFTVKVPLSFID